MAFLTAIQLVTIKKEINELLSAKVKKLIEVYKNTSILYNKDMEKCVMLAMAHEIILPFIVVDDTTDGISNNITDADLQILVEKIYVEFLTLKYPN